MKHIPLELKAKRKDLHKWDCSIIKILLKVWMHLIGEAAMKAIHTKTN